MELTRDQLIEIIDANNGDLDLSGLGLPISRLPDNLTVPGHMTLERNTTLEVLPDGLVVGKTLNIRSSNIRKIGEQTKVGGDLLTSDSKLAVIEWGLRVEGTFIPGYIPLETLPEGLFVGGNLVLNGSNIRRLSPRTTILGELEIAKYSPRNGWEYAWPMLEALPAELTVGELSLVPQMKFRTDCLPIAIPEDIIVLGRLQVGGLQAPDSELVTLPKELTIEGSFAAYGVALPQRLTVGGDCKLSRVDRIPPSLKVGGDLDLRHCWLRGIPGSIEVGSDLLLPDTVEVLGAGLTVGGSLVTKCYSRYRHDEKIKLEIRSGVKIRGSLRICDTHFVPCLPDDIEIGGGITGDIRGLPETWNTINGELGITAERLPRHLQHIAGYLSIPLKTVGSDYLPEGVTIDGNLSDRWHYSEAILPKSLRVGGDIEINHPLSRLPDDLELGGEIAIGRGYRGDPCLKIETREDFLKIARLLEKLPDRLEVKDIFAKVRIVIAPVETPED